MKLGKSQKKRNRIEQRKTIKRNEGIDCKQCGDCCKGVYFPILNPNADIRRYYHIHENIEVVTYEGKTYVRVNARCKHLAENNNCHASKRDGSVSLKRYQCDIYEDRPNICRKGNNVIRKNVIIPENCAFK